MYVTITQLSYGHIDMSRKPKMIVCLAICGQQWLSWWSGKANFHRPIRMHTVVVTGFDASTKDKIGKELFCDMSDMFCYVLIRNTTIKDRNYTV